MLAACLGCLVDSQYDPPSRDFQDNSSSQARHLAIGFIMDELMDELFNPSWRCISMAIVAIRVKWGENTPSREALRAAYTGNPSVALQNLNLVVEKSKHPHCQDRDTLGKYLVKIIKFAGKTAIKTSTDSSGGSTPVFNSDFPSENAVEVVTHRLSYLVTEGGRSTTSSNKDDDELAILFSPVLQNLNMLASIEDYWRGLTFGQLNHKFQQELTELNEMFASFRAAVTKVSLELN
ncbi:hypothetical protein FRC00_005238, partial [Tulasnella sp. 408]